jgi:hypothetical protein
MAMRPAVAIIPAMGPDDVRERELDGAFLAWFEARLSGGDSSDDDALSYLVGLVLCKHRWS